MRKCNFSCANGAAGKLSTRHSFLKLVPHSHESCRSPKWSTRSANIRSWEHHPRDWSTEAWSSRCQDLCVIRRKKPRMGISPCLVLTSTSPGRMFRIPFSEKTIIWFCWSRRSYYAIRITVNSTHHLGFIFPVLRGALKAADSIYP